MEIDEVKKILPKPDVDCLIEKGYEFEVNQLDGNIHVIIDAFGFPAYSPNQASILLILPAGYPNAKPDMFWTYPDVKLKDGRWPAACEVHQDFHGKSWQRWSRHSPAPWRPGVDCLRNYLTMVIREIGKGI
ncbi:MAG: E2/UBC family protein [Smithella sp.]